MKSETNTGGARPLILGAARSGLALARLMRARGGDPHLADARLTRDDLPADLGDVRFLHGGQEITGRILDVTMREGLLVRPAGGKEKRFRLEHLADVRFE